MRPLLVTLVLVLAAGCGSSGHAKASGPKSPDAPRSSAAPVVSAATACNIMIPSGDNGPLFAISHLMTASSATPADLERANEALDTLKKLEPVTTGPLKAQLVQHDRVIGGYLDELNTKGTADFDSTTYKAAGLEITRICETALATGY